MNEELQNALASIIVSAAETAGKAKDFILSEMPDVVQQLLLWKFAEGLILFSVGTLALCGFIINSYRLIKQIAKDGDVTDSTGPWLIASFVSLIPGIPLVIDFIKLDWLQIWLAPKVYLIEYAATLIK